MKFIILITVVLLISSRFLAVVMFRKKRPSVSEIIKCCIIFSNSKMLNESLAIVDSKWTPGYTEQFLYFLPLLHKFILPLMSIVLLCWLNAERIYFQ